MRATTAALAFALGLVTAGPATAAPSRPAAVAPAPRAGALRAFDDKIAATKQAMMGDPLAARKAAEQAVAMATAMASEPGVSPGDAAISLATARWLLGETMIGMNDTAQAKALIDQALASVVRFDPGSKLEGDLRRSRATLAEAAGNVQGALNDYLAAYAIFRAVGQQRSQAIALQDIGGLYLEAGDYARVRDYYGQSLAAYHDDPWLNLATYNNRGQAWREEHKFSQAEAEYRLALTSARQLESPLLEARILTNLADAQSQAGRNDAALKTIAAADRLVRSGEGAGWRPFVQGVRAMIAARRGDHQGAGRLFARAFAGQRLDRTEMPYRELHEAAAETYERLGDRDLALAHLKAFQRLDSEALRLTASASSQLMAAKFDFANLKRGQLERDILIERQRTEFRTRLFTGLGGALLVIFGLLSFGYVSIRRSRDRVRVANTELSATNFALEKALKARTDFLATTSHEIRTPLNGILGMTQVLLADRRLTGDVRDRIELLNDAGETMKSLVDDILDVAKMEAGELTIAMEDVSLSKLIGDIWRLWRAAAAAKGLVLSCSLEDAPERVIVDQDRLRQILSNLLSNAIKFTSQGRVMLNVRGVEHGGRSEVEFVVRDTGIGIAPEDQPMIFEAFTQVNNSTTRDYSGTGLGLTISRRLARALGGDIAIASERGEGACFTVTLPLARIGTANARIDEDAGLSADRLDQASMLLVDRNVAQHALMRILLTPEVRSIDIVVSAEEAIAWMERQHFDHVVIEGASAGSDSMTAIDGIRRIIARADENATRTSLLAAPCETLSAAALFAAGASQVILKPIGAADLIAALKKSYQAPSPAILRDVSSANG